MAGRIAQQLVKHAFRKSTQYVTAGVIGYGIGNALEKDNENTKTNLTIVEHHKPSERGFAIMDIVGIVILVFFVITAMVFVKQICMRKMKQITQNSIEIQMRRIETSTQSNEQRQQQATQMLSARI